MKYSSIASKNINRRQCLLINVFASLLSAKPCIVSINTADGSHHLILPMKSHDIFPCSANSLHCWQNVAGGSLYPPSTNYSSSFSSDTTYLYKSFIICSTVLRLALTASLSQDTCSSNDTPVISTPRHTCIYHLWCRTPFVFVWPSSHRIRNMDFLSSVMKQL